MEYTFSPVNDFGNLASAISNLYGQAAEGQTQRFQALLRGMEETFGPGGLWRCFPLPDARRLAATIRTISTARCWRAA